MCNWLMNKVYCFFKSFCRYIILSATECGFQFIGSIDNLSAFNWFQEHASYIKVFHILCLFSLCFRYTLRSLHSYFYKVIVKFFCIYCMFFIKYTVLLLLLLLLLFLHKCQKLMIFKLEREYNWSYYSTYLFGGI